MMNRNTARILDLHLEERAKTVVCARAVSRVFAQRIAAVREEREWSYEALARILDLAKTDAYRLCNGGKATAEQLARVLAHARRAA